MRWEPRRSPAPGCPHPAGAWLVARGTGGARSGHDPHPSAHRPHPRPGPAHRPRAGGVRVGAHAHAARLGRGARDGVPGRVAVGAATHTGVARLRPPPGTGPSARPGEHHPAGGDPLACRWSRGGPPVQQAADPLRARPPRGRPRRSPRWTGAGRRRRCGALRGPGRWPPRGLRRPRRWVPHHLRTGARGRPGGTARRGRRAAGLARRRPPRLLGGLPALGSARRRGVPRPAHPVARPTCPAAALGGVLPDRGGRPGRDRPPDSGVRTGRSTSCAAAARPGCAVGRPGTR